MPTRTPDRARTVRRTVRRILRTLPAVAWAAGIWALSATPAPPGAQWASWPGADKVAHALLFAGQAATLRFAGLPARAAFLAAVAWGATDELHQRTVPGRTADPFDLLADAFGAAFGAAVRRRPADRRPAR